MKNLSECKPNIPEELKPYIRGLDRLHEENLVLVLEDTMPEATPDERAIPLNLCMHEYWMREALKARKELAELKASIAK